MDSQKWNPHQKIWELLEHFNHLESIIAFKLSEYLWIKEDKKIRILFNSWIIPFWWKIKLLRNYLIYDKWIIDKLDELSRIRNGFAHTYIISQNAKFWYNDWILNEVDVIRTIEIMNSQWLLKEQDLDEMYNRYFLIYEEINSLLWK